MYHQKSDGTFEDVRIHFGLGQAAAIDEIEIQSPSGKSEKVSPSKVDRILTIEEGKGNTGEL
jgi:hypothetical protein